MIPLVEDIISESIESRLKFLKSNVDILDRIFSHASLTNRNKLKEYISNSSIQVVRGFPINQTQLPAFCIMLGGEQEQIGGLNNYLGDDTETFETETITETLPLDVNTGRFKTTHKPLYSIDKFVYDGEEYDGQFAKIVNSNRGIVEIAGDGITDPNIEVTYTYKTRGYSAYGTMFHSHYRVECWSTNGDLTIILYHLLKWIFLSSRDYLAEKNLVVQNLGGLDFEPAQEYFPEFVFRRALTFECNTDAIFDIEYPFIESLDTQGSFS